MRDKNMLGQDQLRYIGCQPKTMTQTYSDSNTLKVMDRKCYFQPVLPFICSNVIFSSRLHLTFVRIGQLACLPAVLRCKCDSAKPLLRDEGEVKKLKGKNFRIHQLADERHLWEVFTLELSSNICKKYSRNIGKKYLGIFGKYLHS